MTGKRAISVVVAALGLLALFLVLRSRPSSPPATADTSSSEETTAGEYFRSRGESPTLTGVSLHQPAPPDLPRATLRGRVVRPDGSPVPGAAVVILGYPPGEAVAVMAERRRESDAAGHFAFPDLMTGRYLLEARLGNDVSPTVATELTESSDPVALTLVRGASLEVAVRSLLTGEPIPGALVRLGLGDEQSGGLDAYSEAVADGDGIAEFQGLIATGIHRLYAEADGYLPGSSTVLPGANPDPTSWQAEIHLDPSVATIEGRVVDVRGAPVPGAKVGWTIGEIEQNIGLFDPMPSPELEGAAISDGDGRFRLAVAPGTGCVVAIPPSRELGVVCAIALRAGGNKSDIEIVVGDGGRVTGVVTENGAPVPGATVFLTMPQWVHQPMFDDAYRFRTTADRRGRFAFRGVDRRALQAYAHTQTGSSELVDVDLESRASADIVIELVHTGRISGRVTDEGGQAVPLAVVEFFAMPDHERETRIVNDQVQLAEVYTKAASIGRVLTDSSGTFAITGLPPSRYAVNAGRVVGSSVPPTYARASKVNVEIGDHVELTLPAIHALTGRVVFEDGAPATDYRISFAYYQRSYADEAFAPPHEIQSEDGYFRIPEVPAGRYGLEITGPEVVPLRLDGPIVVGSGDEDLGTIRVGRGKERTGVVTNKLGEPVTGAVVLMTTGALSGPYRREQTSAAGRFDVPAIRAGETIQIRASSGAQSSTWHEFSAEGPIDIVLDAEGNGGIGGLVIDSWPFADRHLVVTMPGTGEPGVELPIVQTAEIESGGKFHVAEIAAGTYQIGVRRHPDDPAGAGWWIYPGTVTVESMKDTQIVANLMSGEGASQGTTPSEPGPPQQDDSEAGGPRGR